MTLRPIRRALLSVHGRDGIVELGRSLASHGVELVSTGGTASALRGGGLVVRDVAELSGSPEILDGRVKTLHPAVHGGILARRDDAAHMATLDAHGIAPIDLVVVNLYPFARTVRSGAVREACIEQIDVGGPAMLRAAAKNHDAVTVVVDPADYHDLVEQLARGGTDEAFRRRAAAKAFSHVAAYDAAVANWLAADLGEDPPQRLLVAAELSTVLRYGENPHQRGAFYALDGAPHGLAASRVVQGKPLSWNNILDADAALGMVRDLDGPAVAIVKHANPCGVATASDLPTAYAKALACDPVSAFGGIVAVNRPLDGATARAVTGIFTEVVIAPDADAEALAAFARKPALRLLLTGANAAPASAERAIRSVAGGLLVQDLDRRSVTDAELVVVTRRAPTEAERQDLLFAFAVAKHVRSNAIVLARDLATTGIGPGQPNRLDSVRIAARRAEDAGLAGPCVVASDAFFPFADGLELAIAAGATAAIQPGGSVRDAEIVAAADKAGIAMVTTGLRHFRH